MIDTLARAAASMNGVLHGNDRKFTGVSTDTRSLREDELFFALEGPNFDGRDYVNKAGASGAAGAVVKRKTDASLAQITVDDTRLALGRLAAAWREQLAATIVGVTGSNGKTTVKELIKACLQQQGPTFATRGNFNNDIGMPLMLVRIKAKHRFAVLEMGANHAGEIAYLASLAKPAIAVITNAAAAHLEGFGSIEGVAQAKGEILQGLGRDGIAVLNADDEYFSYWASQVEDGQIVSFGLGAGADVRAVDIETGVDGSSFQAAAARRRAGHRAAAGWYAQRPQRLRCRGRRACLWRGAGRHQDGARKRCSGRRSTAAAAAAVMAPRFSMTPTTPIRCRSWPRPSFWRAFRATTGWYSAT